MALNKPQSLQEYMTVADGINLMKQLSQALVRYISYGEIKQLSAIASILAKNPELKAWFQKWLVPNQDKIVGWVGKSFNAQEWQLADQFAPGKVVERSNNPIHNWTLSPEVAKEYATGSADKSANEHVGGYIAKQEMSKQDVILAVSKVSDVFNEWKDSDWGEGVLGSGSDKGKEFMKWVVSLANSAHHFKDEQEILADGKVHSPVIVQKY